MPSSNNGPYVRFRADEALRLRVARIGLFYGNNASAFMKNRVLLHLQADEERMNCSAPGTGTVGELRPTHDSVESLPADLRAQYEELTQKLEALVSGKTADPVSAAVPTRGSSRQPAKRKVGILRDIAEVSLDLFECSAGQPISPSDAPAGKVKVPAKFGLPGAFVLRINGDSMNEAQLPARLGGPGGIQPGDCVIMQWVEHREPRTRDIVAAQILGDGVTLKRYFDSAGAKWLQPESSNPAHQPIALSGDGEPKARVQAVMVGKI